MTEYGNQSPSDLFLMELIRSAQADAWDEGFDAGQSAFRHLNPYREED